MQISVKGADGNTQHQVETSEIMRCEGGSIVFDPASKPDANGFRKGTMTGSSITLLDGRRIEIDPLEYQKILSKL